MKKTIITLLSIFTLGFLISGCSKLGSHSITVDQFCDGGVVEVDQKKAKEDEKFVVTATPDEGYALETITVAKTSDKSTYATSESSPFTVTMGDDDLTVTATFIEESKKESHTITVDPDIKGGKIETDMNSAKYEDTFEVTALPDEGYVLESINVYRTSDQALWKSSTSSPFIVEMGQDDLTISAKFVSSQKEMSSEELASYLTSRVVVVETDLGTGSGFFIDNQGTLVTNYHVIEGASKITVSVSDGTSYKVSALKGFSPLYDIALLQIPVSDNDYLTTTTEVKQGEQVYAMGSPLYEKYSFTSGIISSTDRLDGRRECVQTDTAINPGNSGGPLVNSKGEVIAIVSNKLVGTEIEGMNYAIKISMLEQVNSKQNYSVEEYQKWYQNEIEDSYYACYYKTYYYTTYTNTYSVVTGVKCIKSNDDFTNDQNREEGYVAKHIYYQYKYDEANYQKYCEYLEENGYDYYKDFDCDDHYHYRYRDSYTGLEIEFIIDRDMKHMYVSCPNDEYWYS